METQKIKSKWSNSVGLKVLSILLMILLLMIPKFMIEDLINERSFRKAEIEAEVGKSFGKHQKVMPPLLKIPYSKNIRNGDKAIIKVSKGTITISPENTMINGEIQTEVRKRSIYEIIVYNSELKSNQASTSKR